MQSKINISINILLVIFASLLMSACAGQMNKQKSSVVEFLYSTKPEIKVKQSTPVLHIPISVGIAFVPVQEITQSGRNQWTGAFANIGITEAAKTRILEKVVSDFSDIEYVSEIKVIPSSYLTERGGFSNLDQIKMIYGIDVIALLSFDQVQFTDEDESALSYWTLIGAYLVKGEKNDTSTMLDTAVFDISSRKMLFRAPGTSKVKGSATPVNLSKQLRLDSVKGFEDAAKQMTYNLKIQLEKFKDRIKNKSEPIEIM